MKASVSKSDIIPALQCVYFDKSPSGWGQLIKTYNRVTGNIVYLHQGFPISGLVPFSKLHSFVKSVKTQNIEVLCSDTKLELKAGRASISLSLMDKELFPTCPDSLEQLDRFQKCAIDEDFNVTVVEGLIKCNIVTNNDVPDLKGVFISGNTLFSTNRKQIARLTLSKKVFSDNYCLLISSDFIKAIKGYSTIYKVYVDDLIIWVSCELEDGNGLLTTFGSTIQYESTMNVNKYFPPVLELVDFPKEELLEGLKRVGDFTESDGEQFVKVQFGDVLNISYEGDNIEVKEYFNFGSALYDKPFEVNPYQFLTMLALCDKFTFSINPSPVLYGVTEYHDSKFEVILATKGGN